MPSKPSLPKGTRDFGPEIMVKRNFIIGTIKKVFEKYGYLPLETPSMENLSVLLNQYGEEGDKLLYKIRSNKDLTKKHPELRQTYDYFIPEKSKLGLRYDLTVPLARYVVMNSGSVNYPFKRYQIQPVWRADRPQKGRYREFYQCDADVIGTDSLICEAEIIAMINEVFDGLKIEDYTIRMNHRRVLNGIAEAIGAQGKESDLTIALDKLDKIGNDKVLEELLNRGLPNDSINKLSPILDINGSNGEVLDKLHKVFSVSSNRNPGLRDLEKVLSYTSHLIQGNSHIQIDPTLARGLSYYTGTIFEVKLSSVSVGSVSGGGRYDNLTSNFGLSGISGVGISFGLDRLFDAIEELNLFETQNQITTEVLLVAYDPKCEKYALQVLSELREEGIKSEIFTNKTDKAVLYAKKKLIPDLFRITEKELKSKQFRHQDLRPGKERGLYQTMTVDKIIMHVKNNRIVKSG